MLDNAFLQEVLRVAYDEVNEIFGIDLRETLPDNIIHQNKILMAFIQAITASALICYHNDLRDRLLKHGIDIGSPMSDFSVDQHFESSDSCQPKCQIPSPTQQQEL